MDEVVLPGDSVRLARLLLRSSKLKVFEVVYQGRCFGKPDVRGGFDVRIVPEGYDFYKGAIKTCTDWIGQGPSPEEPVWMSDYDTAMIYSRDYAGMRSPYTEDAEDGDHIVHFKTTREVVLFDLLSERNIRMLLDHFKGDPDVSRDISDITGVEKVEAEKRLRFLYAQNVTSDQAAELNEKYDKPTQFSDWIMDDYVTDPSHPEFDETAVPYDGSLDHHFTNSIMLRDRCGVVHKAGLDGGVSRYSDKRVDVRVVHAIQTMCRDLGVEMHGWHHSETLSQSTGTFNPEVALFSVDDVVEVDCDVPAQSGGTRTNLFAQAVLTCVIIATAFLQG